MVDPYPFKLVKAPVPKPIRPPWWEIVLGWFTCLTFLLLSAVSAIGMLFLIGCLAWRYWPGGS